MPKAKTPLSPELQDAYRIVTRYMRSGEKAYAKNDPRLRAAYTIVAKHTRGFAKGASMARSSEHCKKAAKKSHEVRKAKKAEAHESQSERDARILKSINPSLR